MVGLVIVSHSAPLADGVVSLVRQMGGEELRVLAAGGTDDGEIGTDPVRVQEAIERALSPDGVLVLMDLGSAVLSAETALDLLEPSDAERVLLCEAPLVEGAVAAGVAAAGGAGLEAVAAEARRGLEPKAVHLGTGVGAGPEREPRASGGPEAFARFRVRNAAGLHARPQARVVALAANFAADVEVFNETTGAGPARATSPTGLGLLGASRGHELSVCARGADAEAAVLALRELAERDFDDPPDAPVRVPERAPPATPEPAGGSLEHEPAGGSGPAHATSGQETMLLGLAASPGVAIGPARRFGEAVPEVPRHPAGDPSRERAVLDEARAAVRRDLEDRRETVARRAGPDEAAILDANLGLLDDPGVLEPARAGIERGHNAAAAWADAVEEVARRYRALDDPLLRARAIDLEDVGQRVVRRLVSGDSQGPSQCGRGVLVAGDLSPADAAMLDPSLVQGIATARGGPTSHSAILARALGVPAVVGLGDALLRLEEGRELALDGARGALWVEPAPALRRELERRADDEAARRAGERAHAGAPAVTRDGLRIEVAANLGSLDDARTAVELGAEGVGLLRTEFLFMGREALPGEDEQEAVYRSIAEAMGGRPVILRTLDVGADKPLEALPQPPEDNPFLGARGLRLSLLEPEALRVQLRAALRVAADHPMRVMLPMVSTLDELRAARRLAEEAGGELERRGTRVPERLELGIMVEVPAAALLASRLAPEVDFFSVGTNDLSQYVTAADRGNPRVAGLVDGLHPAVLELIRLTVEAAEAHGRWVGVCGELAADPVATPVLVGLGVRELSMSAASIPAIKRRVRELDAGDARRISAAALGASSAAEVRALVEVRSNHA
jgi:phosphocarrier protein FPr